MAAGILRNVAILLSSRVVDGFVLGGIILLRAFTFEDDDNDEEDEEDGEDEGNSCL